MYQTFEHTADLGLRARADELNQLFADAAAGLFSIVVPDLTTVRPTESVELKVASDDLDLLLFDWLNDLLYIYETQRLLLSRFEVRVEQTSLKATAWGEPIDPARHVLDHEVKAITYHGLKVEREDGGWIAEVIVDI